MNTFSKTFIVAILALFESLNLQSQCVTPEGTRLLNNFDSSGISSVEDGHLFLGYSFIAENDVQVSSLGVYQPVGTWDIWLDPFDPTETDLYGNTSSAHVGIYDDSGILISNALIPPCSSADFNYVDITPINLLSGETYHLVMMTSPGVYYGYGTGAENITFDSNFTVTEMRSSSTNSCCSSLPATLPENTNGWSFGYVFADLTYGNGCTDATACNYGVEAGSCVYPEPGLNCDGTCVNDVDGDGVCDENEVLGCTNPEALNYDEAATDDDGSCVLPGCTYAAATNYDSTATIDDGSCVFPDITSDNQDVYDEAFDAGVASVECPPCANSDCPGDFTADGYIGVDDILLMLSLYDTSCSE